ncbi:hypothetical protein J6590_038002 [Homalodisca vitripennis]|nr:hypothetical protein J6590_038002 [Homalodisca vitripennis]
MPRPPFRVQSPADESLRSAVAKKDSRARAESFPVPWPARACHTGQQWSVTLVAFGQGMVSVQCETTELSTHNGANLNIHIESTLLHISTLCIEGSVPPPYLEIVSKNTVVHAIVHLLRQSEYRFT